MPDDGRRTNRRRPAPDAANGLARDGGSSLAPSRDGFRPLFSRTVNVAQVCCRNIRAFDDTDNLRLRGIVHDREGCQVIFDEELQGTVDAVAQMKRSDVGSHDVGGQDE